MGELSEWLNIMLAEIARKQDDAARALHEQRLRTPEPHGGDPPGLTSPDRTREPR
jgi:hypothetical protein